LLSKKKSSSSVHRFYHYFICGVRVHTAFNKRTGSLYGLTLKWRKYRWKSTFNCGSNGQHINQDFASKLKTIEQQQKTVSVCWVFFCYLVKLRNFYYRNLYFMLNLFISQLLWVSRMTNEIFLLYFFFFYFPGAAAVAILMINFFP
jgi:hypothetical protein